MCEELVFRGHEVVVVTGCPNYPEGVIYEGYEGNDRLDEVIEGVRVLRTRIAPRKQGAINRVRNYYSFSRLGKKRIEDAGEGFDVILVFQLSPVMMAIPALSYAEKHGTPVFHYVVDLWPESLLAGGIRRGSFVYKAFATESRRIYSSADMLTVTSPAFGEYLSKLLGRETHCLYLPQYAEEMFRNLPANPEGLSGDVFPDDVLNVMFAGNVGAAQSVQTLIRAANLLKGEPFRFHIVGSGSELGNCKALASKLDLNNVVFHGRHPLEEMPAYYAKTDAMVATFANDPVLGYTLPRKIQSYMAAGKPVIGTVTGEARRVLEEAHCGFCCEAEDPEGLASCLRRFAALSKQQRRELGANARAYCDEHYSRDRFFNTLIGELERLKGRKHGC
ncbi:glycosyltransferase family 4 protein [Adlercreutzia sp. ZJ138]|uniref:glycosyltransferase family 4 protein n=1 Tax=Adlercreutzia sp. ZJ138 TaxID=2709405 RepID=UPI0013EC293F|nr:glycosyltransferase family 4 protein [Adlercreutzia sp. ZJ138]